MQKFKKIKGSKLAKFLLISVLLLSLLIIAVAAANGSDFTVETWNENGVGGNVELYVSIKNNSDETVNCVFTKVTLPTNDLTLISNSVNVKVNNGAWNKAESAKADIVQNSVDYRYNYNSSSGALLVSLGNIAPGETVTVTYTVSFKSDDTVRINYNFYENNGGEPVQFTRSLTKDIVPMAAVVNPVVEKTSRNLNRSDGKALVGDEIEYTIKATNATSRVDSLWMDVTVEDVLPDGVTFQSGTLKIDGVTATASQYSYNANTRTLIAYMPDLGPNATSTVVFNAKINEDAYGKTIANFATVSGKDREDEEDPEKSKGDNDGDGYTVANAYTIEFIKYPNDVQGTMEPQTIVEDTLTPLNECKYTRPGYVFAGWSEDPNATEPTYTDKQQIIATKDMDLYPVWSDDICTITFVINASDATGTMDPQPAPRNLPVKLKKNEFARTGYTFLGWSTNSNATVATYGDEATITPTGDMTLYAIWSQNPPSTCTITFDENAPDATGTMDPQEVTINVATTLNANAFTRSGYYFRGWSTSSGGEVAYSDGGSITASDDITLYAVWGADPCTITFHKNADDATGTMDPQIVPAKVPVALNRSQFARGGFLFVGWSTDPNSDKVVYGNTMVINPVDDMDLYAVWEEIIFIDDHIAYINGYEDGSVRLGNNITRAEALTIFFRLLANESKNDPVARVFSDVEDGKWYTQAINFMASVGIVDGYQDGTFKPDAPIKRAEFAKMAAGFDSLEASQGNVFTDVDSSYWGYPHIYSAYEKGWVTGYSDDTFRPERYISRAEVISIVNRMLKRAIDDAALTQVVCPFNDSNITNHWAYKDMLEASIGHEYESDANSKEFWTKW